MTMTAKVSTFFGDGRHDFKLGVGQLVELQEKTGCGPEFLMARIRAGTWFAADMAETLRLGLIGGGMEPEKAAVLTERYAGPAYLASAKVPAIAVLAAALAGSEDDAPGETKGRRVKRRATSPTAG